MTANATPTSQYAQTEAAGPAPVLSVRGLTVDYRRHGAGAGTLRAVDDLSFALVPGRTLALVGESGSGKSTVIRTLSGFVAPTAGEIELAGLEDLRGRRARHEYRRALQLVFQDPFASLNPMHTVARHLARPVARYRRQRAGGGARPQVREAVYELLSLVNLTPAADFAAKFPHELSGGQRQRVAIARALATQPRVLLADEPVSMLDVSIRLEILNLLEHLTGTRNLAMLYVTHDLATARHFSEKIMVMYRGTVVEQGPSDEVILRSAHPYTQMLATAAPDPSAGRERLAEARRARIEARAARVAEPVPKAGAGGCAFAGRCPHARELCAEAPPVLPVVQVTRGSQITREGEGDDAGRGHVARCWMLTDPPFTRMEPSTDRG